MERNTSLSCISSKGVLIKFWPKYLNWAMEFFHSDVKLQILATIKKKNSLDGYIFKMLSLEIYS